jgi:hypothetical protein
VVRGFVVGIILGLTLAACASATFPYKYYGIDLADKKLLGPTAPDDVSLSVCEATPNDASPCVAMLTDQYLILKDDYLNTKNQLIACQQQLAVSH